LMRQADVAGATRQLLGGAGVAAAAPSFREASA
jgi:hypothetical protein